MKLRRTALALLGAALSLLTVQIGTAQASVGGYGPIVNVASQGCLGMFRDPAGDFSLYLVDNDCTGSPERQWTEQPVGDGWYRIVNQGSGFCLDSRGLFAIQLSCDDSAGQRWQQVRQPGMPPNAVQLRNPQNGCLELIAFEPTPGDHSQHYMLKAGPCGPWNTQWWEIN